MRKVKESDPCRGCCALQKEKGTVRRNTRKVETREERGEEEEEKEEEGGDAVSRIPSGRLRRRGRS